MRIALLCALTLSACPVASPPDFGTTPALGPLAIGDQLVLGDADADALVILEVDDGALLATRRVPLSGTPSLVMQTPGANVALVLSSSDRRLDIVATDDDARTSVDLGAPFGGLAVSPDGDIAIAYYPPGTANAVFHNENEIALVDLASRVVTRRTLPSLGGAPLALHISPRVGARRYALVLSDEHVAVMALDDFDMAERSVPLVSLTTGGTRTPTGVTFATDDVGLWAIVATREASSVYALEVVPDLTPTDGPDFDVRLSQLAGITPGGTATLLSLDTTLYTLTSSPSTSSLTLTELATATGKTLGVGIAIDHIDLFEGREGRPMALVWSSRDGTRFAVVDLERMAAGANKAFEVRTSRDVFSALLPIPETARFVALHGDADQAVSVIDADTSRVTGFGRTGAVKDLALVPALGRLYLLTHLGNEDFMVSVDLTTLHPEVALVPEGADALALLPGVTTAAAVAYREGGHLGLWPALATGDDRTRVVTGFLLSDLFQRH